MLGATIGVVAFLFMAGFAVFAGIIAAVSTVSGFSKPCEGDED